MAGSGRSGRGRSGRQARLGAGVHVVMLEFFRRLEAICRDHGEVADTDVLDAIADALEGGYVRAETGYKVPRTYQMFSWEGDRDVTLLMEWFVPAASEAAAAAGLDTAHERIAAWNAFRSDELDWTGGGLWSWDPAKFDESGNELS